MKTGNGWAIKPLREVATLQRGLDLPTRDRVAGDFPLISSSGLIDTHNKGAVRGPGVVTGRSGSIGNVFYVEDDFWPLNTVLYVKDFHGNDPRFVYHLLRHLDLTRFAGGTGVPTLNRNIVHEEPIQLPPLPEQQRIVSILDEAFAGIATAKANAEKNLRNARELFESYVKSVFNEKGEDWVETTLGEVGKVSMCKRIFKDQTSAAEGIPFYKIGTFGKEPDSFIPVDIYNEYRKKYSFPKKGDVLVSAAGTIGRRVRYDGEHAYFQDSNIVWIANDETQLLNDYLYHFYGACEWNSTRGATISRLYNDNLKRIVIAFPRSLNEQRRMASKLDVLAVDSKRLATLYQQKLAALDGLKKSLLHKAFTGQLSGASKKELAGV